MLRTITVCPVCYVEFLMGDWDFGQMPCPNGHSAREMEDWSNYVPSVKCNYCKHFDVDLGDRSVGLYDFPYCMKTNSTFLKNFPFKNGCKRFEVMPGKEESLKHALEEDEMYNTKIKPLEDAYRIRKYGKL